MTQLDDKKIEQIISKASSEAVAKMREFHQDDLRVLRERMDIGFESQDRRMDSLDTRMDSLETRMDSLDTRMGSLETRMDSLETRMGNVETDITGIKEKLIEHDQRFDRIENTLATLLKEFQADREKVSQLEAQVVELTERVSILETQLASHRS